MAETITDTIENQLSDLRGQVERITEMLAQGGLHVIDQAGEGVASVAHGTKVAVRHVQDEAAHVAEAARENPIAMSTAALMVAGLAFTAGYLIGSTQHEQHRGWRF